MKKIELYGKYGLGKFALIDDEDFDKSNKYKWTRTVSGYARATLPSSGNKKIWLHKFIVCSSEEQEVDHIDRDKLNCQKENLRMCTHQENSRNTIARKRKWGNLKGAYWDKQIKRWKTSIRVENKTKHIATFDTEFEAAYVYDQISMQLFGEYACTNFEYKEFICF